MSSSFEEIHDNNSDDLELQQNPNEEEVKTDPIQDQLTIDTSGNQQFEDSEPKDEDKIQPESQIILPQPETIISPIKSDQNQPDNSINVENDSLPENSNPVNENENIKDFTINSKKSKLTKFFSSFKVFQGFNYIYLKGLIKYLLSQFGVLLFCFGVFALICVFVDVRNDKNEKTPTFVMGKTIFFFVKKRISLIFFEKSNNFLDGFSLGF